MKYSVHTQSPEYRAYLARIYTLKDEIYKCRTALRDSFSYPVVDIQIMQECRVRWKKRIVETEKELRNIDDYKGLK
jgi:hypothetical protein